MNGYMYAGEWKHDQYHGKGEEHWRFGKESYVGDYIEGVKTGDGTYFYSNGSKYMGQWLNN